MGIPIVSLPGAGVLPSKKTPWEPFNCSMFIPRPNDLTNWVVSSNSGYICICICIRICICICICICIYMYTYTAPITGVLDKLVKPTPNLSVPPSGENCAVFTTLLSAWRTRLHSPGNSAGQNHTAAIGSKEWNISGKTFWKCAGTSPWFPKVNVQDRLHPFSRRILDTLQKALVLAQQDVFLTRYPPSNQMSQWKIMENPSTVDDFPKINSAEFGDFPASHVWGHRFRYPVLGTCLCFPHSDRAIKGRREVPERSQSLGGGSTPGPTSIWNLPWTLNEWIWKTLLVTLLKWPFFAVQCSFSFAQTLQTRVSNLLPIHYGKGPAIELLKWRKSVEIIIFRDGKLRNGKETTKQFWWHSQAPSLVNVPDMFPSL